MAEPQNQSAIRGYEREKPSTPILYDVEPDVALHRAKLELLLRDYEESCRKPRYEDALLWLLPGFAFLIPILTADFKSVLGVEAGYIGGLFLFGAIACIFVALAKVRNLWKHRKEKGVTAREVVDSYIEELQSK